MKKPILYYVMLNGQQLSVEVPTWQVPDHLAAGMARRPVMLPTELHVFDNVFFRTGHPRFRFLPNNKMSIKIKPRKWPRVNVVEYSVGTNLRLNAPFIQVRGFGNTALIAGLRNSEAYEFHVDRADFFCWAPGFTGRGIYAKPFIGQRAITGELFSDNAEVRGAVAAVPCQYPWQRLMCELFTQWLRNEPYARDDRQVAGLADGWDVCVAAASHPKRQAHAMGTSTDEVMRYARSLYVFSRMAQRAALGNASYLREQAQKDPAFKLSQPLSPVRATAERTDQLAIDAQVDRLAQLYAVLGGVPDKTLRFQREAVSHLNRRVKPILQLHQQARANLYGIIGLHPELSKAFGVELTFVDDDDSYHAVHVAQTTLDGVIEPVAKFIVADTNYNERTYGSDRIIAMARIDAAIKWLRNCIPGDTRDNQDVANELESDYLMRMRLYVDKAVRRSV